MTEAKKEAPAKAEPEAKKPAAKADPKPKAAPKPPEPDLNSDPIEPVGVLSHADLSPTEQAKIREPNG